MMAALREREEALAKAGPSARPEAKAAFEAELVQVLPGSEIVGAGQSRLWNTVAALMPEADCQQRWVVNLDKAGFAVSTGSACASGKEVPSHVLQAMGYAPNDANRVLRFSSGWETPIEAWNGLLAALKQVQSGWKNSR